jgi:hypothetical protein
MGVVFLSPPFTVQASVGSYSVASNCEIKIYDTYSATSTTVSLYKNSGSFFISQATLGSWGFSTTLPYTNQLSGPYDWKIYLTTVSDYIMTAFPITGTTTYPFNVTSISPVTCDVFSNASDINVAQNKVIQIVQPTPYGTTTSSTTVTTKVLFVNDALIATTTKAEYSIYNALTNELEYNSYIIVPANYDVSFLIENDVVLATGSKKIIGRYVVAGTDVDLIAPRESFFNVIDNSYYLATGLISPRESGIGSDLSQINCSTFDVGCQFQKAIAFLLVPTPETLNKFSSLGEDLKITIPFGYFTYLIEMRKQFDLTTPIYTFPEIPFISAVFTPIRDVLALILWGIFSISMYNRLKKIEI